MIEAIYENLCPVCGGDLTSGEIKEKKCRKKGLPLFDPPWREDLETLEELFRKVVGSEPKPVQRAWMKRLLSGDSFSVVAPTGLGKTSFGIVASLFMSSKGRKSYVVLPTSVLVEEIGNKLTRHDSRTAIYHGRLKKSEKEKTLQRIRDGDFSILVTTAQFLARNFEMLEGKVFDFIFVDDVDSILKASGNVDRILHLLGFQRQKGKWLREGKHGILIVSTATAKKGRKAQLLRELLGIDVGSSRFLLRNVEDIYLPERNLERLSSILKSMGTGGLIFAPSEEESETIRNELGAEYRIGLATSRSRKDFERFKEGELDILVGTSHYYGVLVRGLDLPERIRYAVFYGAPSIRIALRDLENLPDGMLKLLFFALRADPILREVVNPLKEREKVLKRIAEIMENPEGQAEDFVLRKGEILFPDLRTYLQASGRTSRLTVWGLTKGASFLLEEDRMLLNAFIKRASYYDVDFRPFHDVNLEGLRMELEESRKKIKLRERKDILPVLFVVESPTKARQIARFFGQPATRVFRDEEGVGLVAYEVPTENFVLTVTASLGHITDLTTGRGIYGVEKSNGTFVPVYNSIKKCKRCGYQYTRDGKCPLCGGDPLDSRERIKLLRKLALEAEHVIVGTDPDREGEKIAWDVLMMLSPYVRTARRAEFHEVTKKAIQSALRELRELEEKTVEAQIARRVEDRWFGFRLSEILQKRFRDRNLSAGRAQTPVLGWIIERCDEHRKRVKIGTLRELGLTIENPPYEKVRVKIEKVEEKTEERTPPPPFTTDTLLEDANRFLKLSADEAMRIAQELFENGLITYHRTDSTRVSDRGIQVAREFLGDKFHRREWKGEGAHECIRPTRPIDRERLLRLVLENVIHTSTPITRKHLALYDLIFRRFMASQAESAVVRKVSYSLKLPDRELTVERIVEARGRSFELYKFLKVEKGLPIGEAEHELQIRFVPKAPLYTQSDVIRLMKEKGIGRPSTYSQILNKLFARKYIFEKNGRLIATRRGRIIYHYLRTNYSKYVSEETTRELEKVMDSIEKGERELQGVLHELYADLTLLK